MSPGSVIQSRHKSPHQDQQTREPRRLSPLTVHGALTCELLDKSFSSLCASTTSEDATLWVVIV